MQTDSQESGARPLSRLGFVGLPATEEVPVSGANSGVRSPGAMVQGSWSHTCRLGHLHRSVGTCLGLNRLAAPGPLEWVKPMKIVLIIDVGRIAMAIVLIIELLK